MQCLPQRLKSMFFEKILNGLDRSRWGQRSEKEFQKTLILVFEIIVFVQLPKAHFLTFSSETKIMKITHSVQDRSSTSDML